MDKSLILNEIKKQLNIKTDKAFSEFLGINKSTLSMWRERNYFDIELLFSKCEQIDANFLLTGKGNFFREVESELPEKEKRMERIKQICDNEGISITALETKIGASKGVLSRALNNNTDIVSKWITKIVENFPQYNTRWLLTGEGFMSKDVSAYSFTNEEKVKLLQEKMALLEENRLLLKERNEYDKNICELKMENLKLKVENETLKKVHSNNDQNK